MKLSLLMVLVAVLAQVKPGWTCGVSDDLKDIVKTTGRIVGGVKVKDCSVIPWQVRLRIYTRYYNFTCGGSIISDIHILTAAHCLIGVRNNDQVGVFLADHDSQQDDPGEMKVAIKNFTGHGDYKSSTKEADIAVLTLVNPMEFGDCMKPVCLKPSFDLNGETCIVSGWGDTTWKGTNSRYLRMVKVTAYNGPTCNTMLNIPDANYVRIPEKMICAGHREGGKDSCQGDSGGPLVCLRGNSFVQVGVVAYGKKCGMVGHPGIYTRVSSYQTWIEKVQSENPR